MKKHNVTTGDKYALTSVNFFIKPLLLLCVIALFQACSVSSKWIAPPYTNVSKITQLKAGMSVEEINRVLGIDPYDVYHIQQDGSTVLVYNYRIKDRRMDVSSDPIKKERTIRNEERSQTEGEVWYGESSQVFVLLKENKMKSLITDAGIEGSSYLLLQNNLIQLISKKEMTALQESSATGAGNQDASVIVPLRKSTTKKPAQKEQNVENKGGKAAGVLGTLAATALLVILLVLATE